MLVELWWDAEDAEHIRSRSTRYPDAIDIEPEWTLQAASDPTRVVRDPDPRSRGGLHPAHRLRTQRRLRPHRDHRPPRLLWRDRLEDTRRGPAALPRAKGHR